VSQIQVLLIVASGMAVSAAATFFLVSRGLPSQTADLSSPNPAVTNSQREGAVAALGRLEPQGEVIAISAPAFVEGARVEQLLVQLGARVKAGQVIAVLDSRDRLQAGFERAQTRVQVAQSRLAQVRAGAKKGAIQAQSATIERLQAELQGQIQAQSATIERLQAELNNATAECDRYQKLFRDGAISTSERDNICLKQDTGKEQLAEARATRQRTTATLHQQLSEAKATLNQVAEVRPVDVAAAQAEVNEARAAVREAKANLDLAYVRSPQAGQILKIHTRAGEVVGQKGIVELGQTEQMYAVAEVYETDISRVRTGQRATITNRELTGKLTGTVDESGLQIGKKDVLGTDPAADADARVVEVKIRLDPASSQQVRGLTNLQVNVVIHPQI
jgi:HlyD family secretion protein